MKPIVRINFTDFWEPFDKTNNFFYKILSKKYAIQISENPDYLFYSCYGKEYLKYSCIRIFHASENKRPDFLTCDYAFSFDYIRRINHFRLPLYHVYIDGHDYYNELVKRITPTEAAGIWKKKTKFCCMLVSNPKAKKRIEFFHALSKIKKVDSGGRYLNNIGYIVDDKMEFIKDYKFVLAFENSAHPGYTTEKILEPLVANCIPVYWGNNLIGNDFNPACFINVNDFNDYDGLIRKILFIEQEDDIALTMISQPKFAENTNDHLIVMEQVSDFLDMVIQKNKNSPVAKNKWFHILIAGKKNLRKLKRKFEELFVKNIDLN